MGAKSASRTVQLLETELSLRLVLGYGTVCHMTSSRVTHCHISVVDSKHFHLDSHILQLCFSSFLCVPCGFYLGHVKKFLCNVKDETSHLYCSCSAENGAKVLICWR